MKAAARRCALIIITAMCIASLFSIPAVKVLAEAEDTAPAEEGIPAEDTAPAEDAAQEVFVPCEQAMAVFGSEAFSALPDSDELFGGYFDSLCSAETAGMSLFSAEPAFASRRSTLTGLNLYIYDQLIPQIRQVAAGSRTSTVFTISLKEYFNISDSYYGYFVTPDKLGLPAGITYDELASRLGYNMTDIFSALLYDCPYELYWYDKVTGGNYGYPFQVQNGMVGYQSSINISFYVAKAYSASGTVGTNATSTAKCSAAGNALNTAKMYVSNAAGMTDVDKIRYYYRTVWSLSTYNYEASAMNPIVYGDPWQVIYVFDNDASTTVVCEGYAKALKLLCDLTSFSDPMFECYAVSGNLVSPGANGSHMWNILRMDDGRYYLADITNDTDAEFDICGYSEALSGGYRYGSLHYYYDSRMSTLYVNGELVMSPYAYTGKHASSIPVTGVQIDLAADNTVYLTVGSSYLLPVRIQPEDASNQAVTFSTADPSVASVTADGRVTGVKAGTTSVTVRTADGGRTASCTVTVAGLQNGWYLENGKYFWYENGVKQGTVGRGKEIYFNGDPALSNPGQFPAGWYWLDSVQGGARAVSKDVYQESDAGVWAGNADGTGKWVRYDAAGQMIKGWQKVSGSTWYFDLTFGTMAKGYATIGNTEYYFDPVTGVLQQELGTVPSMGWKRVGGKDYWYENYCRQGVSCVEGYRGKEIYFSGDSALPNPGGLPAGWYWLDSVYGGAKAADKEVYMPYTINGQDTIGKWVRYDGTGQMIKGWYTIDGRRYYYDPVTGAMTKGVKTIGERTYYFDETTGVLLQ